MPAFNSPARQTSACASCASTQRSITCTLASTAALPAGGTAASATRPSRNVWRAPGIWVQLGFIPTGPSHALTTMPSRDRTACMYSPHVPSLGDGDRVTGIRGRPTTGATVTESARVVIGADGMRSLVAPEVRRRAMPPSHPSPVPTTATHRRSGRRCRVLCWPAACGNRLRDQRSASQPHRPQS
jgi:hypothetical protein